MIDNIISTYANAEAVKNTLEHNEDLRKLALEFCSTYKTFIDCDSNSSNRVKVMFENGLDAGHIGIGWHGSERVKYYYYQSSVFVKKERVSVRADKSTRDSSSITGLMRAIAKNKEQPDMQMLLRSFSKGIKFALNTVKQGVTEGIAVNDKLTEDMLVRCVEGTINESEFLLEIKSLYHLLMNRREDAKSRQQDFLRFARGCRAVGIKCLSETNKQCIYYVGSVNATTDPSDRHIDSMTVHSFQRYNDISACEAVAADLAIVKPYMTSLAFRGSINNPIGIPYDDRYYPDVDIATGYEDRNMLWVLIPNES
jgi:hypothetical protein